MADAKHNHLLKGHAGAAAGGEDEDHTRGRHGGAGCRRSPHREEGMGTAGCGRVREVTGRGHELGPGGPCADDGRRSTFSSVLAETGPFVLL